ncbi:MAG: hypothetical protein J2P57_17015 [Acidimicrobiaceae bacterium]|nr:hypothetical protein [Acidimicrobiaceae bacterium]
MASVDSPAANVVYDLVSIQYHALKSSQLHASFMKDAKDHPEVVEFLNEVKAQDDHRALRCHELLTLLTAKTGIG